MSIDYMYIEIKSFLITPNQNDDYFINCFWDLGNISLKKENYIINYIESVIKNLQIFYTIEHNFHDKKNYYIFKNTNCVGNQHYEIETILNSFFSAYNYD